MRHKEQQIYHNKIKQQGATMEICGYKIDGKQRFFLIAGPCVIESEKMAMETAVRLKEITSGLDIFFVFKASCDKANRSSISSFRGPGIKEGLAILKKIKKQLAIPVLTDVHSAEDIMQAKEVVDVLQIPAFLCRQTDLLISAAKSGKAVNVKKGQFIAPEDVSYITEKLTASGCRSYSITERGYTFGYNNLVVDMRAFEIMRSKGIPVVFDATHSTQLPGGGETSGGERNFAPVLARSAAAAGIDGLFMEVHPFPEKALCDSTNQYYLDKTEGLLKTLIEIDKLVKR